MSYESNIKIILDTNKKELVLKTMEGIQLSSIPKINMNSSNTLEDFVNTPDKFITEPMPNLYLVQITL